MSMKNELSIQEIKIGTIVQLTKSELDLSRFIAESMDAFLSDGHLAGFQLAGARLMGIQGEIAYCKMANVYPMSFDFNSFGKYDLIHSGFKVDIKTSEGVKLNVNEKQGKEADVFVLMRRKGTRFKFMGRISKERLMGYPLRELIDKSKARVISAEELK